MYLRVLMTLGNTNAQLHCCNWMASFFPLTADSCPNKPDEYHLEPQAYQGIFEEYCNTMRIQGVIESEILQFAAFQAAWRKNFAYVKIR